MDFQTLEAEKRYSCRSFVQRPIEKNDMEKILEADRITPTAETFSPSVSL